MGKKNKKNKNKKSSKGKQTQAEELQPLPTAEPVVLLPRALDAAPAGETARTNIRSALIGDLSKGNRTRWYSRS
jgi:hypothetical protein